MNCGIHRLLSDITNENKLVESLKITLPGEAKPRQSANGFDTCLKIGFISHFQLYIDGH